MMGRRKIKIARLEKSASRQNTYAKRKHGIAKKVQDLAALCDVDVAVLMYSPSGKPTLCLGENRSLTTILEKLSRLSFQEREGRIRESLDHVKKMMRKVGHHVDTGDFLDESAYDNQRIQGLKNKLEQVKKQVEEANYRLSCWREPEKVDDINMLDEMEATVIRNLHKLSLQREMLGMTATNAFFKQE